MNYYIDFDNTLFDTVSFHRDLLKILLNNGIEESYIKKFYKDNGLNPINLVNSLNNDKINKEVDKLFKNAKNYLYKDALSFLNNKGNKQYILYSYGYLDYQNKKIDNSNIKDYFDEVIITDKDKTKLDLDYQNGIFIDDNTKVIKELLKKDVVKVYRVKRDNNLHSEEKLNNKNVIEIFNMKEIKDE